jgi:hypothetical protein
MLILSDFESTQVIDLAQHRVVSQVIDLAQHRVVFEHFDISELKHGF